MKDISIITVVYNSVNLIEKTIHSVINQSNELNIEYIIIDGASSDGTLDIIYEYNNEIDILHSSNDNGIYDAMNKAIEIANGRYLYFLNAGDTLLPHAFCSLISEINSEFDVIYGNVHVGDTNKIWEAKKTNYILLDMVFSHQAVLVKSSILKKYKFDISYKIASDYDLFLKLYFNNYSFCKTNIVFANYDTSGVSNTNYFSTIKEYLMILFKHAKGRDKFVWPIKYLFNKRVFIVFLILNKLHLINLARKLKFNFYSILKIA